MSDQDSATAHTQQDSNASSRVPSSAPKPSSARVLASTAPPSRTFSGLSLPSPQPNTDAPWTTSPTRKHDPASRAPVVEAVHARSQALSPNRGRTLGASGHAPGTAAAPAERSRILDTRRSSSKSPSLVTDVPNVSSPRLTPPRVKSPPLFALPSREGLVSSNQEPESSSRSPSLGPSHKIPAGLERSLSPQQAQQRTPRTAGTLGTRLETVQEGDHSLSPNARNIEAKPMNQASTERRAPQPPSSSDLTNDVSALGHPEGASTQPDRNTSTTPHPRPPSRKASASSLAPNKTRATVEGSRHMTVETETVASIPQNATNTASDRVSSTRTNTGGSLRTRPSSDTIRPRKEKKKPSRKPLPMVSGPGSSKAELFEQRVASEIEGESTDSDETFVYESNPADTRSQSRHHSRTPSNASLATVAERQRMTLNGRAFTGGENTTERPVRTKRSMKFASNSYVGGSVNDDPTDADRETVRANHSMRSTPRPAIQHKHVGRVHRDPGHGSDSPLDSDSPFSQSRQMRSSTNTGLGWRSPRGDRSLHSDTCTHDRTASSRTFEHVPLNKHGSGTSDDERTPLVRNLRNPRTRGPHHLRHTDVYTQSAHERHSCLSRVLTYIMVGAAILLVLMAGGGAMFATNRPLYNVSIMEVQNVLASEQEIMLDLLVQAVNPNIATIAVTDMDINVFAKSYYVNDPDGDHRGDGREIDSTGRAKRKRQRNASISYQWTLQRAPNPRRASWKFAGPSGCTRRPSPDSYNRRGGVDDGTDPMPCPPWEPDCDDPNKGSDRDRQTMLLGRIFHFDSALAFEPSPLRRTASNSSGELRLAQPGNKTESGGSERWERVTKHPFELIIRGILKYQLPLSTRVQTRSVGASVAVFPEEDVRGGSMRVAMLSRLESLEEGGSEVNLRHEQVDGFDSRANVSKEKKQGREESKLRRR